jgi:hypothetical protein
MLPDGSNAGLYSPDEMRSVNEMRMRARWSLGALLLKTERHQGKRTLSPAETKLTDALARIGLNRQVALEAQRIACMPKDEMEKTLARNHQNDVLTSFSGLVIAARPWWYAARRKTRHRRIAANAIAAPEIIGPYPLIYADPPHSKLEAFDQVGPTLDGIIATLQSSANRQLFDPDAIKH